MGLFRDGSRIMEYGCNEISGHRLIHGEREGGFTVGLGLFDLSCLSVCPAI